MGIKNIKLRIEKLRELINYHNDLYFNQQNPEISDQEYDQLFEQLKQLEYQYPEFYDDNSPTNIVGGNVENTFNDVKHKIPMLSLGKCMNRDQLRDWLLNMKNNGVFDIITELKFDGIAISLIYENGKLIRAATRGNGLIGEDITATVMTIQNIPKNIRELSSLEIRGEIVLLKSGLDKINKISDRAYKNVRNAASGILRTKNPSKENGKYLRFAPYFLQSNFNFKSQLESMDFIQSLGIVFYENPYSNTQFDISKINNIEELTTHFINIFDKIQKNRDSLDFDIDGMVLKSNLRIDQEKLGNKINIPNWAIAYKFESQQKISILEDVEWLLGAKGNITPRARIKPTEIGGTVITKPTLHNIDELKRLDIKIGDQVIIERRGDVIPKITKVLHELRTGDEIDIEIPVVCPECGMPVSFNNAFIRCDNESCSGRQASKIENYIKSLEIDDFGPKVINRLIEVGKLNDLTDIYKLTVNDIATLERMGEKSSTKIINNINKSMSAPLYQIIAGLTIKNVGRENGKVLSNKYKTLENFSKATFKELHLMDGIGPVIAENIINWLSLDDNKDLINKLINYQVGQNEESIDETNDGKLKGYKFSFTGALSISRKEMEKLIINSGGEISGIKKGLDYLIIGKGAKDHKISKAESVGAIVITEGDFYNLQ